MKTQPSRPLYLVARFYAAAFRAALIGSVCIGALMLICLIWIRVDHELLNRIGAGLFISVSILAAFMLYRQADAIVTNYPEPGVYRVTYRKQSEGMPFATSRPGEWGSASQLAGTWMREVEARSPFDAGEEVKRRDPAVHDILAVAFIRRGVLQPNDMSPTPSHAPGKESISPGRIA